MFCTKYSLLLYGVIVWTYHAIPENSVHRSHTMPDIGVGKDTEFDRCRSSGSLECKIWGPYFVLYIPSTISLRDEVIFEENACKFWLYFHIWKCPKRTILINFSVDGHHRWQWGGVKHVTNFIDNLLLEQRSLWVSSSNCSHKAL